MSLLLLDGEISIHYRIGSAKQWNTMVMNRGDTIHILLTKLMSKLMEKQFKRSHHKNSDSSFLALQTLEQYEDGKTRRSSDDEYANLKDTLSHKSCFVVRRFPAHNRYRERFHAEMAEYDKLKHRVSVSLFNEAAATTTESAAAISAAVTAAPTTNPQQQQQRFLETDTEAVRLQKLVSSQQSRYAPLHSHHNSNARAPPRYHPYRAKNSSGGGQNGGGDPPPARYRCHRCNIKGHWIHDCPLRHRRSGSSSVAADVDSHIIQSGGGGSGGDATAAAAPTMIRRRFVIEGGGVPRTSFRKATEEEINTEEFLYFSKEEPDILYVKKHKAVSLNGFF